MPYFSPGDDVVYTPRGCDAKVIRSVGADEYIVEFSDKNLIPPQMQVPGYSLKPKVVPTLWSGGWGGSHWNPGSTNKETNCPKCGYLWTITPGFREDYYDCLRCGIKREDA